MTGSLAVQPFDILHEYALTRIIHERFCCKHGYVAATDSLAVQPFDILHEYALGLHVSECPSRFASARFRDEPS